MCGIVGYVGHRDAVSFILPGLRRLEYRGYDSAGIATVSRMSLDVRKTTGKIADLETLLAGDPPQGTLGVGHTRWATHGRPSDANAHPHLDCQSQVAIVHNGIIENYRELRKALVADGVPIRRHPSTVPWEGEAAEKAGYPNLMLKEIFEQPEAIRNTLRERVDPEGPDIRIPELGLKDRELAGLNRLCFVACGSSWHAALVGKYLVEAFARVPVEVDIASEFRYRHPVLDSRVLTVPISQSGETADTLAALREARHHGSRAIAICNVVGSALAREADGVVYTRAGIEIGVASTKAFTAQLVAVTLLALKLGLAGGFVDPALVRQVVKGLSELPDLMSVVLRQSDAIRRVAERFVNCDHFLYLGRGLHFPLALEGALKLKEISYIHAEGYPAGEMKHGPIALINERMPVVTLAPLDHVFEKMIGNMQEVKARGGSVIALTTRGDAKLHTILDRTRDVVL